MSWVPFWFSLGKANLRQTFLWLALLFAWGVLSTLPGADFALPRSTPEAQGIASVAIRDFIETADREIDTLHSFMLVRHGHVVAEAWWQPESADKRQIGRAHV